MSVEDTLAEVPLFSEMSRRDLKRLASAVIVRPYKRGEMIVKEGEMAVAFYIIRSGSVDVVRNADSGEKIIATLGPGEFFGEMAILDSYPRSASVRAVMDTECLVLSRWDFLAELRSNPYIAVQMLPVLSRRLREYQSPAL
ncbi:MAG: cyclic nucleotide-binding domain-containing protein [Dehalococcoidia bacterium]|nr:cyclic nucleotide-binding domain-containing protein [Dehalococcoidia bacterium]